MGRAAVLWLLGVPITGTSADVGFGLAALVAPAPIGNMEIK